MRRAFLALAMSAALSGCVSMSKPLRNEAGDVITCKAGGVGWLGAPIAMLSQGDCLRKYRKRGFYGLDEVPGGMKLPNSAINFTSGVRLALPEGWLPQPLLDAQRRGGGRLYATNQTLDAGLLVSTIKAGAITDFKTYAETRQRATVAGGVDPGVEDLRLVDVGGRQAAEFGVTKVISGTRIRYQYRIIKGDKEIAMIGVWSSEANYPSSSDRFQDLVSSLQVP